MSKITIYSKACNNVEGFQQLGENFMRKLVIDNKARSTHENYLRQMAKLAIYYGKTPLELKVSELEEYLYHLVQKDTDSRSSFKHLVYGLRKLYQLFDKGDLELSLPSINRKQTLPTVLSHQEVKRLLNAARHLREKVMFGLIYDTGIRIDEFNNLLIRDMDLERRQVHIRRTKNKRHRYLVISSHVVRGIKKHLALHHPATYLFENPNRKGMPISKTRIRTLLKEAVLRAGIRKNVCVHTLRHTYATHQLEAGQDIMTVKGSMGHSSIEHTLLYLQVAQLGTVNKFGCMDMLYPPKQKRG